MDWPRWSLDGGVLALAGHSSSAKRRRREGDEEAEWEKEDQMTVDDI